MNTTVNAFFDKPNTAVAACSVALNGLLANLSHSELSGSGFEKLGQPQFRLHPDEPEMRHDETRSPAEGYYLNGAQYLTGGVGNRLSFL